MTHVAAIRGAAEIQTALPTSAEPTHVIQLVPAGCAREELDAREEAAPALREAVPVQHQEEVAATLETQDTARRNASIHAQITCAALAILIGL